MDVLYSQLALNQLWQLTRTVTSPATKEGSTEFQMLLMNGSNELPAKNPDAGTCEHREPVPCVELVSHIELSERNRAPEAKEIGSIERSHSQHIHEVTTTVIENPYRWFATGVMSFDGKGLVEPGSELNIDKKNAEETSLRSESAVTKFADTSTAIGTKQVAERTFLNVQNFTAEARTRHIDSTRESQRVSQFSAIADFLRKRCTVMESVDDIHIVVRDYDVNEEGRKRIGTELIQAFSQFEKPVRVTWNGKALTTNHSKGEGNAG